MESPEGSNIILKEPKYPRILGTLHHRRLPFAHQKMYLPKMGSVTDNCSKLYRG